MARPLKDWMKRTNEGGAPLQVAHVVRNAKCDLLVALHGRGIWDEKWWTFGDTYYTRWLELSPAATYVVAGSAVAGTVGLLSLPDGKQ